MFDEDVVGDAIKRHYWFGRVMVAAHECDIEVLGELNHVLPGQALTQDQALAYPRDVVHQWTPAQAAPAQAVRQ